MKDAMLFEKTDASTDEVALPPIKDYCKWAFEQAALIRAGQFDQVDILNVADEIESVGKSERRALASNLEVILVHMLKWEYQPAKRSQSWSNSIDVHRYRVAELLEENPSLKPERDDMVRRAYFPARLVAARQTKLLKSRFPETCPYSWSEITDTPYELETES